MVTSLANEATARFLIDEMPRLRGHRGHYFGTSEFNNTDNLSDDEKGFGKELPLSDDDKRALIAFIKTF